MKFQITYNIGKLKVYIKASIGGNKQLLLTIEISTVIWKDFAVIKSDILQKLKHYVNIAT